MLQKTMGKNINGPEKLPKRLRHSEYLKFKK